MTTAHLYHFVSASELHSRVYGFSSSHTNATHHRTCCAIAIVAAGTSTAALDSLLLVGGGGREQCSTAPAPAWARCPHAGCSAAQHSSLLVDCPSPSPGYPSACSSPPRRLRFPSNTCSNRHAAPHQVRSWFDFGTARINILAREAVDDDFAGMGSIPSNSCAQACRQR